MDTMQEYRTYCRICEAACGLIATVDAQGKLHKLRPDRAHPQSQGFVCAKGTRFGELAAHPERLKSPMLRHKDGSLVAISWDEAMQWCGERLRPILETHGPHAIGMYFGNPLAFNAMGAGAMLGLMKGLGSRNVFTAASQDCNNKFAGAQIVHGSPWIHPLPDLEHADLVVFLGSNPAVSQSSFVHLEGGARLLDQLQERGTSFVWVDPRHTESAQRGGLHLAIRPGTDIFLLMGLLHRFRENAHAHPRIQGLDQLLAVASEFPISRVAALTGLSTSSLHGLCAQLARSPRVALHMSVGVNQGPFGTLSYIAMQALSYLLGALDQRGGSIFHPLAAPVTKALDRFGFLNSKARSRIGNFPSVLSTLPGGILADEILEPGQDQIKALIVIAGNPLCSIPGQVKLTRAFDSLNVMIGLDMFENDTLRHADLLLPTTTWLERWDIATTTLLFQHGSILQSAGPVLAPYAETRRERQILTDIARELGVTMFDHSILDRLWRQMPSDKVLHRLGRLFALPFLPRKHQRGYGFPSLRPKAGHYLRRGSQHPNKQLHFWDSVLEPEKQRLRSLATKLEAESQLSSDTGRLQLQLMGRRRRLGHNTWLHKATHNGAPAQVAWMAPSDLTALAHTDESPVMEIQLTNGTTSLTLPVIAKDKVLPGTVVVPHGLPDFNINALLPNNLDAIEALSGQHHMTGISVTVSAAPHPRSTQPEAP